MSAASARDPMVAVGTFGRLTLSEATVVFPLSSRTPVL